jgi:hypothetical protein
LHINPIQAIVVFRGLEIAAKNSQEKCDTNHQSAGSAQRQDTVRSALPPSLFFS